MRNKYKSKSTPQKIYTRSIIKTQLKPYKKIILPESVEVSTKFFRIQWSHAH